MKKNKLILILFCLFIIIFLFILYKPTNYQKKYIVDDYNVTEKYDGIYNIQVADKDYVFNFAFEKKYSPFRNIVKKIYSFKEKKYHCVYFIIPNINNNPLCYEDKELIDFRLIESPKYKQYLGNNFNISKSYVNATIDKYNIFTSEKANYAIWNYKGIDFISKESIEKIILFDNDILDNSLVYMTNNYLFIPNYKSEHYFNNAYLLNLKTGKHKIMDLTYNISYESYVNGHLEDKLYLVDKKEKFQYEIDLIKNEVKVISTEDGLGKIYNNKWEDITINKLVNNNMLFTHKKQYIFKTKNDVLFVQDSLTNNIIQISNISNSKIIQTDEDYIYYLSADILYKYSIVNGESMIMKNYDWKFNSDNKIFIKILE